MRVLVGCEFSGRVRDEFLKLGHDAWSCDIMPTRSPGPHRQCDVKNILGEGWDLMICHPPCTYLTVAGSRFFKRIDWRLKQLGAIELVKALLGADIPRICLENPVGILPRHIGPATQIINPYQFGDPDSKRTCLWLRGLPELRPTDVVQPIGQRKCHNPRWVYTKRSYRSPILKQERSITFRGIARAMADQWGVE